MTFSAISSREARVALEAAAFRTAMGFPEEGDFQGESGFTGTAAFRERRGLDGGNFRDL